MRYIPLLENIPPKGWLDEAAIASQEIEEEAKKGDRAARNALIEKKDVIWKELRDWLLALSNQKCWFSEARDCVLYWEVEHYRPKKSATDLDGNERDGYWWLSLDWKNYRICGRLPNAKKGTYFPVKDIVADENHRDRVDDELPYLLDPTNKHDCRLLSFNQLGQAIPMSGASDWQKSRVEVSVKRYYLYFDKLELRRQEVWDTCSALTNRIQNLMLDEAQNPSAKKRTQIEERMEQLASYTKRDRECSSVAIAYLLKSQIEWAMRIATEAGS